MAFLIVLFGFFLEGASIGPLLGYCVILGIVPIILLLLICAAMFPPDMSR